MAPGGHPMHRANATARAAFKASLPTIRDYAESPGIPSCACKMVLGRPCGGAARLTAADAAEAVRRVTEDFLFVGSQDHFRASVALAHAMLAPDLPPDYAKQVETTSARHGYTRADRDAAVANLTGYVEAWPQFSPETQTMSAKFRNLTVRDWQASGKRLGVPEKRPIRPLKR